MFNCCIDNLNYEIEYALKCNYYYTRYAAAYVNNVFYGSP